ncbi:hypothetical protein [Aeromicrobium ginsengisoli]|uniref:Uncharacterized protein n=1 Tax=Aeromicrobium ginsengisoli TaxID=363867 RepID=A0A5M4FJ65_9ACTN|nr:hypothetical protein [Aeromicrobium ginsengisoli]KAA1400187.1 hypothetical protein ESP70_005530 [Aeromicrobium ginsengisoli]
MEETDDPFDPESLDGLATWTGIGFTTLSGVLTFIGTKDGYLQRILAENATASMWVFVLVGLGVVASLFAMATKTTVHVYAAWVIAAALALATISARLFDDFGETTITGKMLLVCVVLAAVALVWTASVGTTIALPAALLAVAVAATSMGLYGGVKLSVASRSLPEELQTRASLETKGGRDFVKVTVAGSQQKNSVGTVQVVIQDARKNKAGKFPLRIIGRAKFAPDTSNDVAETFNFPIDLASSRRVFVQSCVGKRCTPHEVWRITSPAAKKSK